MWVLLRSQNSLNFGGLVRALNNPTQITLADIYTINYCLYIAVYTLKKTYFFTVKEDKILGHASWFASVSSQWQNERSMFLLNIQQLFNYLFLMPLSL